MLFGQPLVGKASLALQVIIIIIIIIVIIIIIIIIIIMEMSTTPCLSKQFEQSKARTKRYKTTRTSKNTGEHC